MTMNERSDTMLEQTGRVVETDLESVLIETERQSACGQCSMGSSCGTSVIAGLFRKRKNLVSLENHLSLQAGDQVVIGIPESALLHAAFFAYMVPLLFMIAFAMIVSATGASDGIVFLSSLLGLFNGLYFGSVIRVRTLTTEIVLLRKVSGQGVAVNFEHNRGKHI